MRSSESVELLQATSRAHVDAPAPPFRLGKRPELDGIRGLSVLAVIAWHVELPFVRAGNIGVDVFFVLSGFLISVLLMQEWQNSGSIDLKQFYIRRVLRLFPVLFVVLALYTIYAAGYEPAEQAYDSYKYIAATLFYVANWVQVISGLHHPVLGHTWSLAIEEQFYLLFPGILLVLLRWKVSSEKLLIAFAVVIAFTFLNRYVLWTGIESYDRLHMSFDTRADALLIGCFAAVVVVKGYLPTRAGAIVALRIVSMLAAAVLCSFIILGVRNELYYKYNVVGLLSVCVALVVVDLMVSPRSVMKIVLSFPLIVWVGRISYGLYLWHIPVFFFIGKPQAWSGLRLQATRFAVLFVVAGISFYFLEKPFLKLKKWFSTADRIDSTGGIQKALA